MHARKALRAVTLDITGTLLDFGKPVGRTYLEILEKHVQLGANERLALHNGIHRSFAEAYKELRQKHPYYGGKTLSTPDWWHRCIRNTFARCGVHEVPQPAVEEIYAIYEQPSAYTIYPDALRALDVFKQHGLVLGVLTNSDERYDVALLPNMGIRHMFHFVIHSKTELSEKPNSRNFELAHELINSALSKATGTPTQVDPSHIAHIGDDFEADYIGAKRYGFQAFLLDRHGKPERKQKEIAEQAGETQADVLNQPQLYASFDHIIRDLGLERRQFANVASAGSR